LISLSHDRGQRIQAPAFACYGGASHRDSPSNSLANRMLCVTGFSADIVGLQDLDFRWKYGFDQLMQNGLFLHK